jgi:lipopolysaccharide transport system ATP-binding protein
VRLAFSVAAHLEPEILLLDEVLSVGDLPFQRKCMEFAKGLQEKDATILFVSHNMFSIKTMCDRVIYLQKGQVIFDGPTDDGIARFEKDCHLSALHWAKDSPEQQTVRVTEFELLNQEGNPATVFDHGESMTIRLKCNARTAVEDPNFIIAFIRSDGVACCNFSSETDGMRFGVLDGEACIELRTPPLKLVADTYTVSILVREPGFQNVLCAQNGSTFHVRHELFDTHFGVYHEPAQWRASAFSSRRESVAT